MFFFPLLFWKKPWTPRAASKKTQQLPPLVVTNQLNKSLLRWSLFYTHANTQVPAPTMTTSCFLQVPDRPGLPDSGHSHHLQGAREAVSTLARYPGEKKKKKICSHHLFDLIDFLLHRL